MTTQSSNRISFFEPNVFGARHNPVFQTRRPTILVGIQRDVCPPLTFGDTRLERMRIIVVAPEQAAESFDTQPDDVEQDSLAEVLPALPPPWGLTRPAQLQPRPVLGEILRGENGVLYERFGNRIRPLRRLVSGPSGEVLEIADHSDVPPRLHARVPAAAVTADEVEASTDAPESESETTSPPTPSLLNGVRGAANHDATRTPAAFRPLLPEPGQWRVVRLGDFKPMLVPQLVYPERLRDVHRLPCYVQVFELTAPQRMEALAEALFGDASATSQLRPLTPAIVQQLQLAPLLPAPTRPPRPVTRQAGLLLPHDRVIYLEVANDPTDDTQEEKSHPTQPELPTAQASEPPLPSPTREAGQGVGSRTHPSNRVLPAQPAPDHVAQTAAPIAESATPSPPAQPAAPGPPVLKTSIPTQFLKPWEFRFSREEALFEMSRAWSFTGRLRALLRRLTGGLLFSNEFRRWQVMLSGRSLDEQLWTVRPPRGGLSHRFVREWAHHTLGLAGYDPQAMLMEWEIFWRRKSL